MGAKVEYTVSVLTFLFYVNLGCEIQRDICDYDINCSSYIDFFQIDQFRTNDDHCRSEYYSLQRNGYYYGRIRLSINYIELNTSDVLQLSPYTSFERETIDDDVFLLIVSLEITKSRLEIYPVLEKLINIQMLNLTHNRLRTVNLFDNAELNELINIDVSHNTITSIEVDKDQYVYKNLRTLNLSHNFLTSIPGGTFEELRYLEYLDLSNNNIASIDHYSFEGLKSLRYLYLSHNNISDINVSLFRFNSLEELYLDSNNIENLTPRDFLQLRRIQKLDLDYNKLRSIEKDIFNDMDSLSTLKLSHNFLSHIHKDSFSAANNLKDVDLSNNLLNNLPKNLFRNNNLTSLTIIGNNIKGPIARGTFEGLKLLTELDVSFQCITEIEELAFFDMERLTTLLLNNNEIQTISNHSFDTLKQVKHLDLSHNLILNLDFYKKDLLSLEFLSINHNYVSQILFDNLSGLSKLRFLDLSHNNVSKLDPNSFNSLEALESFELTHNPISGALLKNSFNGLHYIPTLDISHAFIKSIQNMSFSSMVQLQELNISHSLINELEYNAFLNTGNIQIIDLSFNKLTHFHVSWNDLTKLKTIFLNNNYLVRFFFKNMPLLSKVILSYNFITNIDNETFIDQTNLSFLDLSFNYNLTFHMSAIDNARNLDKLTLSSVKNEIDFAKIDTLSLREFEMSHSRVSNVSILHLNEIKHLKKLILSNNIINELEYVAFRNISVLEWLDLSFNNISFIQPGTFKDNVFLYNLNLSHNSLTSLNYGIFRGLASLNILDVSFNNIYDLGRERFYDTQNLEKLIVDHNKISDIVKDFFGDHLNFLSIGDNPLPCEKIITLKRRSRFRVSALHIDENNGDNVDGVRCSMDNHVSHLKTDVTKLKENEKALVDIRDILFNLSKGNLAFKLPTDHTHLVDSELKNSELLKNVIDKIDKYNTDQFKDQANLKTITSKMADDLKISNSFLDRILKFILGFGALQTKPATVTIINATSNENNDTLNENKFKLAALTSDVNQVKHELLYIENIISEIDRKLSVSGTVVTSTLEKSNRSDHLVTMNTNKSLVFLEVCVSLILTMLVCFLLYKLYQAKIFLPRSRSLSSRHITETLDNSTL